jgi:pyruvate/2-oxoglutarate dehydrogenase complex dihydrolipoamide dehydrogenase (E3) component
MTIPLLADDPHDRALLANVKPHDWANPTPAPRYHLVVLGGGPAGLVAAAVAAGLGAKVALVERDRLGGDCLNVGCVPSKTLLRAARSLGEVRRAREFGIAVGEPAVDFAAVMERVRRVRAELSPLDSAKRFRKLGIDVFLGDARFVGGDVVEVAGAKLRFGRCLIATGSRPAVPQIDGLADSRWFTNDTLFTLTELPKSLLVIGAGPVGCELGQAFARFGAKVTISTHGARLLPREDDDASEFLARVFLSEGITVTDAVDKVEGFDAVLVSAGREPNVEDLNLPAAGVAFDTRNGVAVDRHLRTTNQRVFAAGDVCSLGYKFAHAADAMARVAVRNALFPTKARATSLVIPWCTYTSPEVAHVGCGQDAEAVDVFRHDFDRLDRAATDGAGGFIKVLVAKGTDRIVGATVVGPHAGEVIGTVSVAMTNGVGLKKLSATVFPYPTYTEALKKAADAHARTRLTPFAARILRTWLRWFR